MTLLPFIQLASDLEAAGLVWQPEIGDEVAERDHLETVSILIDPHGLSPDRLRYIFMWLPTVDQLVLQFEARQAVLFHAGLELSDNVYRYKTVVQTRTGPIESCAYTLRTSLGMALRKLLLNSVPVQ